MSLDKGEIASLSVNAFYKKLISGKPKSKKAQTFFKEWERIFGIVYGQDITKAENDAKELAKLYGVSGRLRLKEGL